MRSVHHRMTLRRSAIGGRRPAVGVLLGITLCLVAFSSCSDDQAAPQRIGPNSNTVTAPTTTPTSTVPPATDGTVVSGDDDDPMTQIADMVARLDAATDSEGDLDVCAIRSVWLDLDTVTGPATVEQAKAYVDMKLRLIGMTANAAPDRLSKDADVLRAHGLAAGSAAAAKGFDPGYLRSKSFDVLNQPEYVKALGRIRGWMDDECGDPDVTVP